MPLTKEEFEELDAYERGYAVYQHGADPNYPNVPDEDNPYEPGSANFYDWISGGTAAMFDAMDVE